MKRVPLFRNRFYFGAVAAAVLLIVAGCGGGGSGGSPDSSGAPTAATRAQVETMHGLAFRAMMQNGMPGPITAFSTSGGSGASSGMEGDTFVSPALPLLGSFLRDVAASPPASRAARRARSWQMRTRQAEPPSEPLVPSPPPPTIPPPADARAYFDYYLGLWVQVTEGAGETRFELFADEAMTTPAGNIVTSWPADWETYPQVYTSSYTFTAGNLAGSHGFSENINNADWSGSYRYETVYPDGWTDSGESAWSGLGGYSWQSLTTAPDGKKVQGRGGSLPNGDSGTHIETSEGMTLDYTYKANGSGHGVISGPYPGLPVTITWTGFARFAVRYADGTLETLPGWYGYGYIYGGDDRPVLIDDGGLTGN